MGNRFDYVAYDEQSQKKQADLKAAFKKLEHMVTRSLPNGRAKEHVFDALEVAYAWCGKAIRDEQLDERGPGLLQEERNNDE